MIDRYLLWFAKLESFLSPMNKWLPDVSVDSEDNNQWTSQLSVQVDREILHQSLEKRTNRTIFDHKRERFSFVTFGISRIIADRASIRFGRP